MVANHCHRCQSGFASCDAEVSEDVGDESVEYHLEE